MKIEQLEQLIRIAELGSMNEAAKSLYISRSSLSESMKKLEEELGKEIFTRHPKGVRLTDFGTVVLKQAKGICDRVSFLREVSHEGSVSRLTIASMYCSMASDAFADLMKDYPDERRYAVIEECPLEHVIHQVSDGRCRIGVLTEYEENRTVVSHLLEENHLEFHALCERTFGAIVGQNNPLYHSGLEEVELRDLLQYPLLQNYAAPADPAQTYSRAFMANLNDQIQVSDLGLALRLVAESNAVMIDMDNNQFYRKLYACSDTRFIPIRGVSKGRTGWVVLQNTKLTALEQEFIKLLEKKALALG